MSVLKKLYFLANSDISLYTKDSLSEKEEGVIRDFAWMYADEIKDSRGIGSIGASKRFAEFVQNEHPEQEADQIDGFFVLDSPFIYQSSFDAPEIKSIKTAGFNPESKEDLNNFYLTLDPMRRQDFFIVAHSWNTMNNKLVDFKGYFTFVKTGHAPDIAPRRYINSFQFSQTD
jgi:hypothetical protein